MNNQTIFSLGFFILFLLHTGFFWGNFFLLWHVVLWLGHLLAIYYMLSTPFEYEIYLGFPTSEPIQEPNLETTFFGGSPIFLSEP